MPDEKKWFQTTAIDYPNSRPHIGTAFEKLGADVQARYRRMEGYDVLFLMGNDENTVKVAKKAAELGQDVQSLLRRHGPAVPGGLGRAGHQLRRLHPDQRAAPPPRLPQVHPEGVRQRLHLQGQIRGLVLRGLRGVQDREGGQGSERGLPIPPDHAGDPSQRAVLLLRAVEVPGPAAQASTRNIPTSSSRRAGATKSSNLVQPRSARTSTSPASARPGASACRSTRSSRSTSGSTPC